MIEGVIGALSALLLASLGALHQANTRARAAEERTAQQVTALLDRVSTEPRFEVRPAAPAVPVSTERRYIADHMADDEAWNEYRGEPAEEDDE